MKKLFILISLSLFSGIHLSSFNVSAQNCTQLGLPEQAIARFCIPNNTYPDDLHFSPNGMTLAILTEWYSSNQVIIWDIENKTVKTTIETVNGYYVRFSPDGKTLVCGDVVYDTTTGEPKLLLLDGDGYRDYVVFSPDGKIIAGAGQKGIRFWKSNTEELPADALPMDDIPINVLPTDTSAVVAENPENNPTSTPFATSSTTVPGIRGLSYSPDGKELAIACYLGIWIYDAELNTEITLLTRELVGHVARVLSVTYSPDGNTLASAGRDATIRIWDAKTKKHKFTFSRPKSPAGSLNEITKIAFSSEGNLLISAHDSGQIHIWNTKTEEYKYTLHANNRGVKRTVFSPNGNFIASPIRDNKTILLWNFTSYPIVSISPDSVTSLTIGEELAFDVNITRGKDLSGYQATIEYDPGSLEYVETNYGDVLSGGVPVQPIVSTRNGTIQLAALSLTGVESNGDGVLATIKFKVIADKASKLGLRDVILTNSEGKESYAWIDGAQLLKTVITEDGESVTCSTNISEDVNKDCVVNIQDLVLVATKFGDRGGIPEDVNGDGTVNIVDLVLVAGAFGNTAGAPVIYAEGQEMLSAFNVQQWLRDAQTVNSIDPTFQRGILVLEQLLMAVLPQETALLPNYPNPFNPETWIPYQLATPESVSISIYSADGTLVRTLVLGNQVAGLYQNRSRAAYWNGKNDVDEAVSSGVYFYTLTAGEFSATRKMLILK